MTFVLIPLREAYDSRSSEIRQLPRDSAAKRPNEGPMKALILDGCVRFLSVFPAFGASSKICYWKLRIVCLLVAICNAWVSHLSRSC